MHACRRTQADLEWAFGVLLSRCVRMEGRGGAQALAPWADLLNHDVAATCHLDWEAGEAAAAGPGPGSSGSSSSSSGGGSLVMRTDREYQPGDQVCKCPAKRLAWCRLAGSLLPLLLSLLRQLCKGGPTGGPADDTVESAHCSTAAWLRLFTKTRPAHRCLMPTAGLDRPCVHVTGSLCACARVCLCTWLHDAVISYGPKSSGELLLSYGFCPPPATNPHEAYSLHLAVSPDDPLADLKRKALAQHGEAAAPFPPRVRRWQQLPACLLVWFTGWERSLLARFVCTPAEGLEKRDVMTACRYLTWDLRFGWAVAGSRDGVAAAA